MKNKRPLVLNIVDEKLLRNQFYIKILLAICIIVILTIGAIVCIKLDYIMKSQIDIADQVSYARQDVESINTSQENRSQVNSVALDGQERELIERVVAAEARGEGIIGMEAVAQTILDRAELWNMTVTDVVTAAGQYADPYQGEISDSIHLAVANVFDGGIRIFDQPVTHFYSGSEPYWADEKIDRGGIGCHRFLY